MSSPPKAPASEPDPRLAVALHRAERRREMLERMADMGMALAAEINQRYIEGPRRPEPRPDPARAFAAVSRAVRLTLILEAKIEKQILAWRKGDLSSIKALVLPPEPFLKPRFDSGLSRRERVRDQVSAAIEREAGDPNEAEWMRDRVRRELIEIEHLDDHRLEGDFRACVETICSDLGLEPDWSQWSDEAGFLIPPPPEEAGEGDPEGVEGAATPTNGRREEHRREVTAVPSRAAPSTPSGSPSPLVFPKGEELKRSPPPGAIDPAIAEVRRARLAGVDFALAPDHAPLATEWAHRPPPSHPPEPKPKMPSDSPGPPIRPLNASRLA